MVAEDDDLFFGARDADEELSVGALGVVTGDALHGCDLSFVGYGGGEDHHFTLAALEPFDGVDDEGFVGEPFLGHVLPDLYDLCSEGSNDADIFQCELSFGYQHFYEGGDDLRFFLVFLQAVSLRGFDEDDAFFADVVEWIFGW